jgi:SAM-dependent methyltransferase
MTGSDLQAQIAAARAYEALLVPSLFGRWTDGVAAAAQVNRGDRVVDVGCGTGVLARCVASIVAPGGLVTGVDPNPGMLEVARQLAPNITWQLGFAESLPCADAAFDAVVSQFGLMFFADHSRSVREMSRVLVPGGRVAIAVWDDLGKTPAYNTEVDLLERTAGRAAADALRAPFRLGDPSMLMALLEGAGFESVRVTSDARMAEFPGVRPMVEADLRGWLPVMGVALDEDQIGRILGEAEHALQRFVTDRGTVAFEARALIATASRP